MNSGILPEWGITGWLESNILTIKDFSGIYAKECGLLQLQVITLISDFQPFSTHSLLTMY